MEPLRTNLPWDLFEQITPWMPSPRDLLSLALASRACKEHIIPHHLEYREIYIINATATEFLPFWEHLARRPDLSRNIRTLTLGHRANRDRLPSAFRPTGNIPSTRQFDMSKRAAVRAIMAKAIWNMEQLEKFSWGMEGYTHPPIGIAVEDDEFWGALCRRRYLRTLELAMLFGRDEESHSDSNASSQNSSNPLSPLWQISNLRCFALVDTLRSWTQANDDSLCNMLKRSPDLKTLSLAFMRPPCDIAVFSRCQFKQLQVVDFDIMCLAGETSETDLDRFLERHDTIQDLTLYTHYRRSLSLGTLGGGVQA